MATPKKPAARAATKRAEVTAMKPAETFMQVERWEGKTWRGQKFRIRITDTRNGNVLFAGGEPYADARDRDALFDRCVAMGMRPLTIP